MLKQVLEDNGVSSMITGLARTEVQMFSEIQILVPESEFELANKLKEAFFKA